MKNLSVKIEMLQNHRRHLLCRPRHKWRNAKHHQMRNRPSGIPHNHYEEEEVEILWARHKSQ